MKDTVRVLIADDHPLFREGMRGRLDRVADITVVGEAASGDEAVELARKLEPHAIFMDIQMPGLNGIEATREIQQASPRVDVLVLTMFEDDDSVFAAMRAGASPPPVCTTPFARVPLSTRVRRAGASLVLCTSFRSGKPLPHARGT
jgi:CheY-like chemotaxis protein